MTEVADFNEHQIETIQGLVDQGSLQVYSRGSLESGNIHPRTAQLLEKKNIAINVGRDEETGRSIYAPTDLAKELMQ